MSYALFQMAEQGLSSCVILISSLLVLQMVRVTVLSRKRCIFIFTKVYLNLKSSFHWRYYRTLVSVKIHLDLSYEFNETGSNQFIWYNCNKTSHSCIMGQILLGERYFCNLSFQPRFDKLNYKVKQHSFTHIS